MLTHPRGMLNYKELVVVLFEYSAFPIQVFDLEGKLLNKLIRESRLDQRCHFGLTLDR